MVGILVQLVSSYVQVFVSDFSLDALNSVMIPHIIIKQYVATDLTRDTRLHVTYYIKSYNARAVHQSWVAITVDFL